MPTKTKQAARKAEPRQGRPALGREDLFYKFGGKPHIATHDWLEYDAKQTLDIPVKQKHIDAGVPGATPECILALAGSDYFDNKLVVEVGCTVFRVIDDKKKKRLTFRIPAALRKRLRLFDTMAFWDLPPAIYRLYPVVRKARQRKRAAAARGRQSGNLHLVNGQVVNGRVQKKPKKKNASPTRVVSRGRIVRWAKPIVKRAK